MLLLSSIVMNRPSKKRTYENKKMKVIKKMKQKAISLSLPFLIQNEKKKTLVWPGQAVYSRDDRMERVREQRDVFCSSWEFMSCEEFSGKLKILLQSFITHFQGSSSCFSFIFLFIFSTALFFVTVLLNDNVYSLTYFYLFSYTVSLLFFNWKV